MADPLVEVEGLWRRFDVSKPWLNRVIEREDRQFLTAVADVSFTIARGETFALVGESGSGKSTIAKMIVGLLGASEGRILFDGQEIAGTAGSAMRTLRSRFQMIFQDPFASLNPRWHVGDISARAIHRFGLLKGKRRAVTDIRIASSSTLRSWPHVELSSPTPGASPTSRTGGAKAPSASRIAQRALIVRKPEFNRTATSRRKRGSETVSVAGPEILKLISAKTSRGREFGADLCPLHQPTDSVGVRHMANRNRRALPLGGWWRLPKAKGLLPDAAATPITRMPSIPSPILELSGADAGDRSAPAEKIPNPYLRRPTGGVLSIPCCPA